MQGARSYLTELIARVIKDTIIHKPDTYTMHFRDYATFIRFVLVITSHDVKIRADVFHPAFGYDIIGTIDRRTRRITMSDARRVAAHFVSDPRGFFEFSSEDVNKMYVDRRDNSIQLYDFLDADDPSVIVRRDAHSDQITTTTPFREVLDPTSYIVPPSLPAGLQHTYEYQPPHATRSAFGSDVKTGHSFAFKSGHFTGSGSNVKIKNGITQLELENTANSGGAYKKNPLVYVHTAKGRDPTGLVAPLSSFRMLGGQVHPVLGNREEKEKSIRYQMGHRNLRKITEEHKNEAIKRELARRHAKKRKRNNSS